MVCKDAKKNMFYLPVPVTSQQYCYFPTSSSLSFLQPIPRYYRGTGLAALSMGAWVVSELERFSNLKKTVTVTAKTFYSQIHVTLQSLDYSFQNTCFCQHSVFFTLITQDDLHTIIILKGKEHH